MITPELVGIVVGFLVTLLTIVWQAGTLKGQVLTRLTTLETEVRELRNAIHGRLGSV